MNCCKPEPPPAVARSPAPKPVTPIIALEAMAAVYRAAGQPDRPDMIFPTAVALAGRIREIDADPAVQQMVLDFFCGMLAAKVRYRIKT